VNPDTANVTTSAVEVEEDSTQATVESAEEPPILSIVYEPTVVPLLYCTFNLICFNNVFKESPSVSVLVEESVVIATIAKVLVIPLDNLALTVSQP
jgi:hypothetical protein